MLAIDSLFTERRGQLAAMYQYRDFAAAAGVMSYGGSLTEPYRPVGLYTGRTLKGEKPADLPVQQVTAAGGQVIA